MAERGTEDQQLLHVIDLGRTRGCLGCVLELGALVAVTLGFLGVMIGFVVSRRTSAPGALPDVNLFLTFSGTALLLGLAGLWFVPRQLGVSKVELFSDHVRVYPLGRALSWRSDVLGFDDGATDRIALRALGGSLVVPTPTENDRVAVLRILEAKGIRRDG